MKLPYDSVTLTQIQKSHDALSDVLESGTSMDNPHLVQELAANLCQALDHYYLHVKATHEELNKAIDKYNTAMDGDSGDEECEAACELRDLVEVSIKGEAVEAPASTRLALAKGEEFILGFEDDETQEGIPELLTLIREAVGYQAA